MTSMGEAPFPASRVMMTMMMVLMAALVEPRADCHTTEHLAVYKSSVYLRCHDDTTDPSTWSYCYQWIVPSGDILTDDQPMPDDRKYSLSQNGSILHIHRVKDKDFGLYHCLVFPNVSTSKIVRVTQHGLNTNYPPSQDQLLTKYTSNIQYGVMAGFVVLVVMAMLCYNYDQHQERFDITPPWLCETSRAVQQRKDSTEGQELKTLSECEDASHYNQGFDVKGELSMGGGKEDVKGELSSDGGNKDVNFPQKKIQTKL